MNGFLHSTCNKGQKIFLKIIALIGLILIYAAPQSYGDAQQTGKTGNAVAIELNYKPGEVTVARMEYGNLTREYRYYVPRNFDLKEKHPLILVLHGYNQPIETMVMGFQSAHAYADTDGTVLIYPVGTGSFEQKNLAWNTAYGPLGGTEQVDDIGYLTFLIDLFINKLNCDADRVYVTGTSMGGAMTYALSCYIPEKLAAVAPAIVQMGKTLVEKFQDAKPLPIMMVTGTADPLIPPSGVNGEHFRVISMVDNIHYWKNRNHITGIATVSDIPDLCNERTNGVETPSSIKKYEWESANGNEIVWLNVINGGHWLPAYFDGNPVDPATFGMNMGTWNCDYNSAVAIYKFLLSHKRR